MQNIQEKEFHSVYKMNNVINETKLQKFQKKFVDSKRLFLELKKNRAVFKLG